MPLPFLGAHLRSVDRLEAEESLLAAERIAVGAGMMLKGDRHAVLSRWREAAVSAQRAERPMTRGGLLAVLAGSGIGFELMPRKAEQP